jgi:hypothetical protein
MKLRNRDYPIMFMRPVIIKWKKLITIIPTFTIHWTNCIFTIDFDWLNFRIRFEIHDYD